MTLGKWDPQVLASKDQLVSQGLQAFRAIQDLQDRKAPVEILGFRVQMARKESWASLAGWESLGLKDTVGFLEPLGGEAKSDSVDVMEQQAV